VSEDFPITIFHNPGCGTSRNVVAMVEAQGFRPKVVEYLKAGWTRPQLQDLFHRMGVNARDVLRARGTPAAELGLLEASASEEAILEAMVAHPILVERPIVATPKGAALCRPAERALELLDQGSLRARP
jgi:arsenate reductase